MTDARVTVTYYTGSIRDTSQVGQVVELDWADLPDWLFARGITDPTAEKGAAGYVVAAPVIGQRRADNARPTRVLALDWDKPGAAPFNPEALAGLEYFAYTTDSHLVKCEDNRNGDERWRVWVLLDREYSAAEVQAAYSGVPWAGAVLRSIAQPVFLPTKADTAISHVGEGEAVALSGWVSKPLREAPSETPWAPPAKVKRPSQASTNALVARWLGDPSGTNDLAGATGSCLAEWGWSDDDIAAYLATWLGQDERLAKHTNDAVRAAAKRRANDRITGFPKLAEMLGVQFEAERATLDDELWALVEANAPVATAEDLSGPPFFLRSAQDICSKPLPDIQWVCEALSLAPGAPGLCTGYSGVGKTTALQDLALSVATEGRLWLGQLKVRHGAVAHVDLEQGEQQTYRTYRALGATPDAQLVVSVLPTWQLTDPANLAALGRLAVGRVLIIIDSFRAACLSGDENDSEFAAPLADLSRISEATGCTFMLNHHSGKNNDNRMKSARGTSAITAAVSVHWSFEREDLDPTTRPCLQLVKSRNHATDAMIWETYVEKVGSADNFRLHARAQAAVAPEDIELDAAILDALRYDTVRNIAELATQIERRRADVSAACKRLGVVSQKGILVVKK